MNPLSEATMQQQKAIGEPMAFYVKFRSLSSIIRDSTQEVVGPLKKLYVILIQNPFRHGKACCYDWVYNLGHLYLTDGAHKHG